MRRVDAMKRVGSRGVALIYLLPFLGAGDVGCPTPGGSVSRDVATAAVRGADHEAGGVAREAQLSRGDVVILGAGDQASISEQGRTVTIERQAASPQELRRIGAWRDREELRRN